MLKEISSGNKINKGFFSFVPPEQSRLIAMENYNNDLSLIETNLDYIITTEEVRNFMISYLHNTNIHPVLKMMDSNSNFEITNKIIQIINNFNSYEPSIINVIQNNSYILNTNKIANSFLFDSPNIIFEILGETRDSIENTILLSFIGGLNLDIITILDNIKLLN